jgi:hypothetical protein
MSEFRKPYEYQEDKSITGFLLVFFIMLLTMEVLLGAATIVQGYRAFRDTPGLGFCGRGFGIHPAHPCYQHRLEEKLPAWRDVVKDFPDPTRPRPGARVYRSLCSAFPAAEQFRGASLSTHAPDHESDRSHRLRRLVQRGVVCVLPEVEEGQEAAGGLTEEELTVRRPAAQGLPFVDVHCQTERARAGRMESNCRADFRMLFPGDAFHDPHRMHASSAREHNCRRRPRIHP